MIKPSIRVVEERDLDRCFEIESSAYEGDEAASKSKILSRIRTYPDGFIVLEQDSHVVGFINCGACHEVNLSDEKFKELVGHDPEGKHIVIMSVAVHPNYQKNGYARELMMHFIEHMRSLEKVEIHLICQTELIKFYQQFGFQYDKASDSEHGGLSWHEMSLDLS